MGLRALTQNLVDLLELRSIQFRLATYPPHESNLAYTAATFRTIGSRLDG
jgi:hypothetical protein